MIDPTIEDNFDLFKQSIGPAKRYYINDKTWLTQREYLCINLWIKGYISGDIAEVFNESIKTVHSYIDQTKIKLNCTKRSDVYMAFTRIFGIG